MKYAVTTARQLVDAHGQRILQFEEAYAEFLEQFGFQLFVIPLLTDIQSIYHLHPKMIFLPGGGDVPAQYYDADMEVASQECRDLIEMLLISFALENHIPLLGICRGMQMINGFLGGKLTRVLNKSHPVAVNHFIHISNCSDTYEINSFHRDVIRINALSDKLEAIALHENYGHVEAFVGYKQPILGMQWHPERMDKCTSGRKYSNKLVAELIAKGGK